MALVRWNPWHEIDTLQSQINRLFDEALVPTTRREDRGFLKVPAGEMNQDLRRAALN